MGAEKFLIPETFRNTQLIPQDFFSAMREKWNNKKYLTNVLWYIYGYG